MTAACSGAGRSWSRSPRRRSAALCARGCPRPRRRSSPRPATPGWPRRNSRVQDDTIAFLEVNPRLQVEHTVTEQVTGLDLVELGLRVADGATLSTLGLDPPGWTPGWRARGVAIQVRVNAETLQPDGTLLPGGGTLTRFQPPAGRGVRVDTAGYRGYTVNPRYDSLLAKVITGGGTLEEAARRAARALAEFDIAGVPTNVALLQALLRLPALGTIEVGWVDAHAAELAADGAASLVPADRGPLPAARSPR